jgi:hypothetical protein
MEGYSTFKIGTAGKRRIAVEYSIERYPPQNRGGGKTAGGFNVWNPGFSPQVARFRLRGNEYFCLIFGFPAQERKFSCLISSIPFR